VSALQNASEADLMNTIKIERQARKRTKLGLYWEFQKIIENRFFSRKTSQNISSKNVYLTHSRAGRPARLALLKIVYPLMIFKLTKQFHFRTFK
jgi:hypothetical protein